MTEEYHVTRPLKRPPIHPGEILREDIIPALRMTVSDVARELGITRQALHRVLAEEAAISPEMAVRLGKFCGNGPDIWSRMQSAYDVWHAAEKLGSAIDNIPTHAA